MGWGGRMLGVGQLGGRMPDAAPDLQIRKQMW